MSNIRRYSPPRKKLPASAGGPPRYRVQHRNGTWHVFDTFHYRVVESYDLEKDALFSLAGLSRPH